MHIFYAFNSFRIWYVVIVFFEFKVVLNLVGSALSNVFYYINALIYTITPDTLMHPVNNWLNSEG